jgi:hypothetical protein
LVPMKRTKVTLLVISALLVIGGAVFAQTPEEVLGGVNVIGNASNSIIEIDMNIHTGRGSKDRTLEIYYTEEADGTVKSLAQVISPAFLRNLKFLSYMYPDGRADQWVKTSRGVRRLSGGSGAGQELFDSDFTTEDLSDVSPADYDLDFLPGETILDREVFSVQAKPKNRGAEYSEKIYYVGKASGLLLGIDYIKGNDLVKRYRVNVTQEIDGDLFPEECTMENLTRDTSTVLFFQSIETPNSIPGTVYNKGRL